MSIAADTVRVRAVAKASWWSGGLPYQPYHSWRYRSASPPAVPQRSYTAGTPSRRQRAASRSSSPSG